MTSRLDQQRAIELLDRQIKAGEAVKASLDDWDMLTPWRLSTIAILERIFGRPSRQLQGFEGARFAPFASVADGRQAARNADAFRRGVTSSLHTLRSALEELREFWEDDHRAEHSAAATALNRIDLLCERFHQVARQLRQRHDDRTTLEMLDEYDVQDLMHALLLIDFNDVRREEWTPSHAGASARMDFVLRSEQIVLEVKRSRPSMKPRDLGEQLIIDVEKYARHPDCKLLVCFVYDPEGIIGNPRGIENDLTKPDAQPPVKVFIRP